MHKNHQAIMHELRDYASPKARLTRMIKSGDVIQVRRGIFLDGKEKNAYSLKSLAAVIYGPSYISFEYALAHYGLIPERVQAVTSAAYNKNKNRRFSTPLGDFYYYYLPAAVFPYGVVLGSENDQSYLMATPEKALCDTLYKTRGIGSLKALRALLFEDWRMERDALLSLDRASILFLAPLYRKKIFRLLLQWLEGEANHA
jgi:predicted transcriptional regulator of viral defense system